MDRSYYVIAKYNTTDEAVELKALPLRTVTNGVMKATNCGRVYMYSLT